MNNFISDPKELISDSLQDVLPTDEMSQAYAEMFISILLEAPDKSNSVLGTLLGIEFSEHITKIDIRISLSDAFDTISKYLLDLKKISFNSVAIALDDRISKFDGPFDIVNAKIIDFDANSKLCVLAIDLIKKPEELP